MTPAKMGRSMKNRERFIGPVPFCRAPPSACAVRAAAVRRGLRSRRGLGGNDADIRRARAACRPRARGRPPPGPSARRAGRRARVPSSTSRYPTLFSAETTNTNFLLWSKPIARSGTSIMSRSRLLASRTETNMPGTSVRVRVIEPGAGADGARVGVELVVEVLYEAAINAARCRPGAGARPGCVPSCALPMAASRMVSR